MTTGHPVPVVLWPGETELMYESKFLAWMSAKAAAKGQKWESFPPPKIRNYRISFADKRADNYLRNRENRFGYSSSITRKDSKKRKVTGPAAYASVHHKQLIDRGYQTSSDPYIPTNQNQVGSLANAQGLGPSYCGVAQQGYVPQGNVLAPQSPKVEEEDEEKLDCSCACARKVQLLDKDLGSLFETTDQVRDRLKSFEEHSDGKFAYWTELKEQREKLNVVDMKVENLLSKFENLFLQVQLEFERANRPSSIQPFVAPNRAHGSSSN